MRFGGVDTVLLPSVYTITVISFWSSFVYFYIFHIYSNRSKWNEMKCERMHEKNKKRFPCRSNVSHSFFVYFIDSCCQLPSPFTDFFFLLLSREKSEPNKSLSWWKWNVNMNRGGLLVEIDVFAILQIDWQIFTVSSTKYIIIIITFSILLLLSIFHQINITLLPLPLPLPVPVPLPMRNMPN